jgi:hypothetical protein
VSGTGLNWAGEAATAKVLSFSRLLCVVSHCLPYKHQWRKSPCSFTLEQVQHFLSGLERFHVVLPVATVALPSGGWALL